MTSFSHGTGDVGGLDDDGDASEDGGPKLDLAPVDPGPAYACSADLKEVRDRETGELVERCAADDGCLAGRCVPACDAAAGSKGSFGCRFFVPTTLINYYGVSGDTFDGACHALMVANAWDRPVKLELSYGEQDLDVTAASWIPTGLGESTTYQPLPAEGIPPGQVAIVFLSHLPGAMNGESLECPRQPAVIADTAISGTASGSTFELRADTPIQLYDIRPYGGAKTFTPSASLLYPTSSWGTDYLAITPHSGLGTNWMTVIASSDGTRVRVWPTAQIRPGTIADAPPQQTTEYIIDAGQALQWTSDDEFAGSIVTAEQPVAMFTGATSLAVRTADVGLGDSDSSHQQIVDVHALGTEYVGAGLVSRFSAGTPESVLYRIIGVVDGTHLEWDPAPPTGAPSTLEAGQVFEFESRTIFSVRSRDEDHPISLTQYMSSGVEDPMEQASRGGPDWIMLLPPDQFLTRYPFFVDPTFESTNLVFVRKKGPDGFADVTLSCMGTVRGWEPVGNAGQYQVAKVEILREGTVLLPTCTTSQHEAHSDLPFGVTVWGTARSSSYGYPAGGNMQPLNEVDIVPVG